MELRTKRRTRKAYIKPIIINRAGVRAQAAGSHIRIVERIQYNMLRRIMDALEK